jgi:hypothetical protein
MAFSIVVPYFLEDVEKIDGMTPVIVQHLVH